MNTRKTILTVAVLAGISLQSCIFEYPDNCPEPGVTVSYDWAELRGNGIELPEGMSVIFYPEEGVGTWRYELPVEGGTVDPPDGRYHVMSFNNDTRSVTVEESGSFDAAVAHAHGGRLLQVMRGEFAESAAPPMDEQQPVASPPDMLAVAVESTPWRMEGYTATLRLLPKQFTCRYDVTVRDVSNTASIAALSMQMSNLAAGKVLSDSRRLSQTVTIPAELEVTDSTTLRGTLLSFGPAMGAEKIALGVNIWLKDGQKRSYSFDVSSQVLPREDALNLNVEVGGIDLPEVTDSGSVGNIQVGVDNWEFIDIELTN